MNFKRFNGSTWETARHKCYGSGTDSLTAFPAVIQASGDPLTDYTIYGNTVQNGTPTPEAPVDVVGCGERTGNLFDISTVEKGRIDKGVVGYASATTNLSITGNKIEFTTDAAYRGVCSGFIEIPSGIETVSFSGVFSGGAGIGKKVVFYDAQKTWLNADITFSVTVDSATVTIPSGAKYIRMSFTAQTVETARISNFMLNAGSKALPYEPYGYKIPISSANTTTPVYLGEVETTRKIKKLVLTGEETGWSTYQRSDSTTVPYLPISNFKGASATNVKADIICTHYSAATQVNIQNKTIRTGIAGRTSIGIIIADERISTLSDFKIFFAQQHAAGTPVTIWYVLTEPETGIVNEPLMKIGYYADTITMAQAGETIPTFDGDNTITFGTSVQPSAMSATFKGWHAVQAAKTYDGSEWR